MSASHRTAAAARKAADPRPVCGVEPGCTNRTARVCGSCGRACCKAHSRGSGSTPDWFCTTCDPRGPR